MVKKILVTGALGQIGSELVPTLQKKYGINNIIASDIKPRPSTIDGLYEILDICDLEKLEALIKNHNVAEIYHLASLLSATGEQNPNLAWKVNMEGLKNILDMATKYKIRVFWPSSIAVFGPTTPRKNTPQTTILEPTTMYGVTKVAGELLCQYYFLKNKVDVRSVRYPGIISWKTPPGGGTTDFAVAIFYEGLRTGKYECFVGPTTTLPMMYMEDAINATLKIMEVPVGKIKTRTSYNLAAISFSAKELTAEINKYYKVKVTYKPDFHQAIADSWPKSINDKEARKDWGWRHKYNLTKITKDMISSLQKKFENG
jgi:nucleoside-diphosphate-sugar epimerase